MRKMLYFCPGPVVLVEEILGVCASNLGVNLIECKTTHSSAESTSYADHSPFNLLLLRRFQVIYTKPVSHSFMHTGKPSNTLSLLYTFWLFLVVPLMLDMSCLTPRPKLSLPSYWQKAILEVSMWGEICQLFSSTLHQSKKKRESAIGCLLWGRGRSLQTWACSPLAKRLLLILKALLETRRDSMVDVLSSSFFRWKVLCFSGARGGHARIYSF